MTKTVHRALIGVAAAVLAAGSGLGLAAAPAAAAPVVPVSVALSSGTVAPGASKFSDVVITNDSPGEVAGLRLIVDESAVDQSKITVFHHSDCTTDAAGGFDCPLDVTTLGASQKATFGVSLNSVSKAATGPAGHLDVRVQWSTGGLTRSFPLTVAGHGPDLRMDTPDVPQMLDDNGQIYVGKLGPGDSGALVALFENFGDTAAGDLKLTVTLPAGAIWDDTLIKRFPEDFVGCTFTGRTAKCDFGALILTPESQIVGSWLWSIGFPVKLAPDAKSGVNLRGGTAQIVGTPVAKASADAARKAAAKAPRGLLAETDATLPTEVDGADNSSAFAVLVKTWGEGGGTPPGGGSAGSGSAGGGSGGGGLPITGPVAASVAGAGAVVLAVGTFLVLAARRRRISFAAPGDENR
jgi:hypothetical protein